MREYGATIAGFTAAMAALTLLLSWWSVYVELLGLDALMLEASLGLPQFMRNRAQSSTHGMRCSGAPRTNRSQRCSVFMVASWLSGDIFKTVYFVVRAAPFQACCALPTSAPDPLAVCLLWGVAGVRRCGHPAAGVPVCGERKAAGGPAGQGRRVVVQKVRWRNFPRARPCMSHMFSDDDDAGDAFEDDLDDCSEAADYVCAPGGATELYLNRVASLHAETARRHLYL